MSRARARRRPSPVMPAKLDIVKAYKALHIAPDLSPAGRQVGFAIVDSFNKKTGLCEPSQARLAMLLKKDIRSVKRAVNELACATEHRLALLTKWSHGGRFHQASYQPDWPVLRSICDAWEARANASWRSPDDDTNVTELSPSTGQNCPLDGDENVPQTLSITNFKYPSEQVERREGSHRAVAELKASERIERRLRKLDERVYALAIDLDSSVWTDAVALETAKPGSGSRFILETMRREAAA